MADYGDDAESESGSGDADPDYGQDAADFTAAARVVFNDSASFEDRSAALKEAIKICAENDAGDAASPVKPLPKGGGPAALLLAFSRKKKGG